MTQKICPFCKSNIPEDARFCPECGKKINPPTCPSCGAEILGEASFCHKCGKEINATPAPAVSKPLSPSRPIQKSVTPIVAQTVSASGKQPTTPVKKKSHAGLVAFLLLFFIFIAVIIAYSIMHSNQTKNNGTIISSPALTVDENNALWTQLNNALIQFVGNNLPVFATAETANVTQDQIDQVTQQMSDFDKALSALESAVPPPENEIVNNTLLPLYRNVYNTMVTVRDALVSGNTQKLDLEVRRLGILIDELSGAAGIMAPDLPSENVTISSITPVVETMVTTPSSVLPLPTGTPTKPENLLANDAEYFLIYTVYNNWGYDFASSFAKYSQNAVNNTWTTWWMGNTSNEQQRLNFSLVDDKWKPDSMPPLPSNIPLKPANLLADDSWYFLMYTVYNTSWGFNFSTSFTTYSQQAVDNKWTNFWMGDTSNTSKRLNFHLVGDKWALD
jgi:hypothetical protein